MTITFDTDTQLEPDQTAETQPWRGLLALEGEPTSDGRTFEHATWRELPLPLSWQIENWDGHSGSVVVGRIDTITRNGNELHGTGIIDLGQDAGRELVRQMRLDMQRGVSIDAAIGDGEITADENGNMNISSVEIGGATIVSFPAFAQATVELVDGTDSDTETEASAYEWLDTSRTISTTTTNGDFIDAVQLLADRAGLTGKASGSTGLPLADKGRAWDGGAARSRVKSWAGGVNAKYGQAFFVVDGPPDQAGSYHLGFADVVDGKLTAIPRGVIAAAGAVQGSRGASNPAFQQAKPKIAAYYKRMDMTPPWQSKSSVDDVVTADGAAWRPPAEWFEDPQLDHRHGLHVTEDGRIFGHLYGWGECHIGSAPGQCIQVPPGGDYSYIIGVDGRGVICDDGSHVQTGPLSLAADHAELRGVTWLQAKDHYAHTALAVGDCVCGEDEHGIWVAGAVRPGTSPELIYALRASAPSGDWRTVAGRLQLVAMLGVSTPGYPAIAASFSGGEITALVARSPHGDGDCGCGGSTAVQSLLERLEALEATIEAPRRLERSEAIRAALAAMDNSPADAVARLLADMAAPGCTCGQQPHRLVCALVLGDH